MRSDTVKIGIERAPHRSLLRACGIQDEDFSKPFVAVVNSYVDIIPGHAHLKEVGEFVKQCIIEAGGVPFVFNTIGIDDGIAMGHEGMKYSLPSRELIADSVESMIRAHCFDAMICIPNCDKIVPGMMMAAMRCNIPTIFCSGGPMEAGRNPDGTFSDLISIFEGVGGHTVGTVSSEQLNALEHDACPACGSCSGMFTANSMNCLAEAMGLALPGNGTILATSDERLNHYRRSAFQLMELLKKDIKPRDIATEKAFDNAYILDMAMGGSTNTLLHGLAIAYEAGLKYDVMRVNELSKKTPNICKLSPSYKYHIEDCACAGGISTILYELMQGCPGLLHTDCLTVTGETLGDNIAKYSIRSDKHIPMAEQISEKGCMATGRKTAQVREVIAAATKTIKSRIAAKFKSDGSESLFEFTGTPLPAMADLDPMLVIRPTSNPYSQTGGISILYGNLAKECAVVKTAGVDPKMLVHKGPAVIFESQEDACEGILGGKVKAGDVVVIRNEGPKGGPGMQEMLAPTSYIKGMGLGDKVALITDGRFSGGTAGACIGHISPEAAAGGVIGLLRVGDIISIDIPNNSILVELSEAEIATRAEAWKQAGGFKSRLPEDLRRGWLGRYAVLATSAGTGGVLKA